MSDRRRILLALLSPVAFAVVHGGANQNVLAQSNAKERAQWLLQEGNNRSALSEARGDVKLLREFDSSRANNPTNVMSQNPYLPVSANPYPYQPVSANQHAYQPVAANQYMYHPDWHSQLPRDSAPFQPVSNGQVGNGQPNDAVLYATYAQETVVQEPVRAVPLKTNTTIGKASPLSLDPAAPFNVSSFEPIEIGTTDAEFAPKASDSKPPASKLQPVSIYADSDMYESEGQEEIPAQRAVPRSELESTNLLESDFEYSPYPFGILGEGCRNGLLWCSRSGLIGGAQGTFLAPTKDSQLSVSMIDMVNNVTRTEESDFGFGGGVRTWLGIQSENVGFRVVYWGFENNHYRPDSGTNAMGSSGFSNNYFLTANTLDIEMFNGYCFGASTVRASLGARYADMERQSMILGRGKVGDVGLLGIASSMADLQGWGVVAGLEGTIPLRPWFRDPGCGPSPCNFFWKVQGSALAADTKAVAVTQVHVTPPEELFATAYSSDEAMAFGDSTLLVGLLQLGLDYRIPIHRCHRPAFVDFMCGFEAQTWQTGEAAATSASNAFLAGAIDGNTFGGSVAATSYANPSSIGFYGFVMGMSLSY